MGHSALGYYYSGSCVGFSGNATAHGGHSMGAGGTNSNNGATPGGGGGGGIQTQAGGDGGDGYAEIWYPL